MNSKQYFDQNAQQWDRMRADFFSEAVREKALAVAGIQSGRLAADIGAGTGFITEGLIREGLQVIAVDMSQSMLETMREKFGSAKGIDYRPGSAENLPIASNSVDYVFANMYLHHVDSPPQAIAEMVRILKSGGKLVLTDLDEHQFDFLRTEQHDRWLGFKRQDVHDWLTAAGLKQVAVDCVGENCCAPSGQGDDYANISIFVASGEK
jgi:ubiquinone/menaquinone biosynthesis C-methylase UbiE